MSPGAVAAALLGAVIGFVVGHAHARASRAWRDHRATKAAVPTTRATAWGFTGASLGRWAVAALFVAAIVSAAVRG